MGDPDQIYKNCCDSVTLACLKIQEVACLTYSDAVGHGYVTQRQNRSGRSKEWNRMSKARFTCEKYKTLQGNRFIHGSINQMMLQTKVKQDQVIWPPEDLTLVKNPSTRALKLCFVSE